MDSFSTDDLIEAWSERIDELEQEEEEIESKQDPMVKGDNAAVYERAEPTIKRKTITSCIEDLEDSSDIDDVFANLGRWRDEIEEKDKRYSSNKEYFRNTTQRRKLQDLASDLVEAISDEEFEECRCGELKMPTRDRNYNKNFRWECVNDDCFR